MQLIGPGAFAGCCFLNQHSVDSDNAVYTTIDGILYNKNEKALISVPGSCSSSLISVLSGKEKPLSIPEGIVKIDDYAFYGIGIGARDFSIPATVEKIGKYAFAYADFKLLPNEILGLSNVKNIDDYSFSYAEMPGIDFGTIATIGNYAFENAVLSASRSLKFPNTLNNLGIGAFKNFGGKRTVSSGGLSAIDLSKTKLETISESAFQNCWIYGGNGVKEILLPSCLKRIETHAFEGIGVEDSYNSYSFSPVGMKIPAAVESIQESAFETAGIILQFQEGSKLLEIGDKCFYNACIWLSDGDKVVLPEGIETLGSQAFYSFNISSLYIPGSVNNIGDNLVDRSTTKLEIIPNTYGALYASENGYSTNNAGGDDTSWLNN